jgi:hypothetical protein
MAVFYFDILTENQLAIDDEGMDLRNLLAAQDEAGRAIAAFARDSIRVEGARGKLMSIWVRDKTGPVMEVNFLLKS